MPANFFQRLHDYYLNVAKVLRGEAAPASIFPNAGDIGASRERVYAEFLRRHAPSKCNVRFGGFLFDEHGNESRQIDVIVTTDTTPQFNFYNPDGGGKSFSPVDGTIGVATIKSFLDKNQLLDALSNLASIPPCGEPHLNPMVKGMGSAYADWPFKIVYASNGLSGQTAMCHLMDHLSNTPEIPSTRRPNVIHVAGKFVIFRATEGYSIKGCEPLPPGGFILFENHPDLQAIVWTLYELQKNAQGTNHMLFDYSWLANKTVEGGLLPPPPAPA